MAGVLDISRVIDDNLPLAPAASSWKTQACSRCTEVVTYQSCAHRTSVDVDPRQNLAGTGESTNSECCMYWMAIFC